MKKKEVVIPSGGLFKFKEDISKIQIDKNVLIGIIILISAIILLLNIYGKCFIP